MNWRQLQVTDGDGDSFGDLGTLVETAPANLDSATIEDGKIVSWDGFFMAAPDEDPDWDTPRVEVDWTGFQETWDVACGQA